MDSFVSKEVYIKNILIFNNEIILKVRFTFFLKKKNFYLLD